MNLRVKPSLLVATGVGCTSLGSLFFLVGVTRALNVRNLSDYVFVSNVLAFLSVLFVAPSMSLAFHSKIEGEKATQNTMLRETKVVVLTLRLLLTLIAAIVLISGHGVPTVSVVVCSYLWLLLAQHISFCRGILLGGKKWWRVLVLLGLDGFTKVLGTLFIVLVPGQSITSVFLTLVISALPVAVVGSQLIENLRPLSDPSFSSLQISRTTGNRFLAAFLANITIQTQVSMPMILTTLELGTTKNFVPLVMALTVSRIPLSFSSSLTVPIITEFSASVQIAQQNGTINLDVQRRLVARATRQLVVLGVVSFALTLAAVGILYQQPFARVLAYAGLLALSSTAISVGDLLTGIALVKLQEKFAVLQWLVSLISLVLAFVFLPFEGDLLILGSVTLSALSNVLVIVLITRYMDGE